MTGWFQFSRPGVTPTAPTGITLSNSSMADNIAAGGVIGGLSMVGGTGPFVFTVVANTKAATSGTNLVRSATGSLTIGVSESVTVHGVDANGLSPSDVVFSIAVTDHLAATTLTTATLLSKSGSNIPALTIFEGTIPIAPGAVSSGQRIKLLDSASNVLSVQEDNRAGDQRWVFVTALLSAAPSAALTSISVQAEAGSPVTGTPITLSNLTGALIGGESYECKLTLTLPDASVYTASARDILLAPNFWNPGLGAAQYRGTFRSGPLCTEFIGSVPFKVGAIPHPHLRVEFQIAAYKLSSGAFDASTNPIVAVRTTYTIENGWKAVASPRDFVYDLLEQKGSSLSTVRNYNGAAGNATLTLGATNGQTSVTRGSGAWPAIDTATPENNIVGKALVEVGGNGIGFLNGYVSSTVLTVSIPSDAPYYFASTSRTSAQWRTMGVYQSHRCDFSNVRFPIWQGTVQPAVWVLPTAYIIASQMVQNIDTAVVPVASISATGLTAIEGCHPMGMAAQNGAVHSCTTNEGQTGGADGIGVLPYSHMQALLNWGNAATHLAARANLEINGNITNQFPRTYRDEEHGGLLGIDEDAVYSSTITQMQHQIYTTDYTAGVVNWFTWRADHTTNYSYLAYLLRGHFQDLVGLVKQSMYGTLLTNDGGQNKTYPCTLVGPHVTTSQANEYQTGEALKVVFNYGFFTPQTSAGPLATSNRYFWRMVDANNGDLYDTYAHAIAGGPTGLVAWASDGTTPALWNGYNKSQFQAGIQMRAQAWDLRDKAMVLSLFPNAIAPGLISRSHTRANLQRRFNNMGTYWKGLLVDDAHFQADGPRFIDWSKRPSWQKHYILTSVVHAAETGIMSANWTAFLNWWLADEIGMCTSTDVVPQFAAAAYYLNIYKGDGSKAYTYDDFYGDANVKYPWSGLGSGIVLLDVGGGDLWQYKATIASVTDQTNVAITLNKNYFDNSSAVARNRHVGAWIQVGSGFGQIKSVSSAVACVADSTINTGWMDPVFAELLGTIHNAPFSTGSLQVANLSWPSKGNGVTIATGVVGADGNTNIMRAGYGVDRDYAALAKLGVEYAKQYGINATNYAAAISMLTTMAVPMGALTDDAIRNKWYIKAR